MRTSFMPPHLTAQSLATQPVAKSAALQPTQDGFETLPLKSAQPTKVIVPRQLEQRSDDGSKPAPAASAPNAHSATDELSRRARPGSKLDIRV